MIGTAWRAITFPFRKTPWWGYLLIVAVLGWFGRNILLIAATIVAFHPVPIPPLFQGEPETIVEARLQDLEHFDHVRRKERSFTDAARAEFQAGIIALGERVGELTDAGFMLELARLQATIDNGHSNGSATRMVQGFPRLPIRSAWFGDELRILRVLEGHEDLLGARILTVNGQSVDAASEAFRSAFGGNDTHFRSFNPVLLETPAYLEAVGMAEDTETVRLTVQRQSGDVEAVTFPVQSPEEGASRVFSGDLLQPWLNESDAWQAFEPESGISATTLLARPDNGYWAAVMPNTDAFYVSLRENFDDDSGESLANFSTRILDEITELEPRSVIIDQRFNGGGDFTLTHEFMQSTAARLGEDGRIYLLVSGNTFSAGIVNLAVAEQSAPDQVFLVGEPIGDRLQFWAEGWAFELPNSRFRARFSTGFYDLQNGCEGIFRCHCGSLHLMPILVDDLDIDFEAPMTFAAYASGHDPAVEAILNLEGAR